MPRAAKVAVAVAGVWVLSPIDLIPEFLPVIGPLDDVIVVALALRFAARRVPHEAIHEAWPADPALLDRLLRPRRVTTSLTRQIIRTLTINPNRSYHGTGRPLGGPKGPRKTKNPNP